MQLLEGEVQIPFSVPISGICSQFYFLCVDMFLWRILSYWVHFKLITHLIILLDLSFWFVI